MKKINYLLFSINVILISVFPFQAVSAIDVPLKKGTNPGGTIGTNSVVKSNLFNTVSVIPVTASLEETELKLNFTSSIGTTHVYILDQNGSVVYQNTVNTNTTSELIIPTDLYDIGNYTLKIEYGTSKLVGEFQLN